ncbi:DNA-directed RNA polymerase, subunit H, RpoH/RPB5 [Caldisphaera lagunensis DSM 15908]|uniref:DNA-directed RNA polymerase subunit Rpo5 n=1 Tax=Caldisphaera lagunensis (strain DSM 15908 / JCM 11604 / ANMR 0165 / IC-154) TaxID=1056495 RepID=L0ACP5_CALLD|nr:DNA-directed RNA polymerase subunit H [Caldisphaera lagunensis]AFZ71199.1 DNA-directed RNA polymerase, subunit H, RpoH/RPB5 [Caldisphaera lagunensis DSM 15908]
MPSKLREEDKILGHYLVPKHRILPLEESVEVLKSLGIKPWQLPRISINDPVVKILGGKPGDIIEIERDSPTAGKYKAYRVVVSY